MKTRALGLLALASLSTGCATSYNARPPLSFQDFDYSSPDGKPWPLQRLALSDTASLHGLKAVPQVAYVELNPEGQQTVLFIHGLGSYLKFWRYQLDAFAQQGYRVLAVDLPGYGKSDKPASFPYTMEAMGDVVHELAQKLGVQKPILVGHSMGGQTSLSYALRYPEEVKALVLTSPAGFEKFSAREKAWFHRSCTTALVKSAHEYGIRGSVRQSNFERWRPELNWLIEERVRVAKSPEFDSYAYANVRTVTGLAHNDFVRDSLHRVSVPTLIIYGEDDRLIPNPFLHGGEVRDVMSYGHTHIRGSKLVGLDRCGHTVQMDCPQDYNAQVLAFLNGLESSTQP